MREFVYWCLVGVSLFLGVAGVVRRDSIVLETSIVFGVAALIIREK